MDTVGVNRIGMLKPPFDIYHDGMQIGDANGHLCSAENPEIAKAILAALEASQRLRPALALPSTRLDTP